MHRHQLPRSCVAGRFDALLAACLFLPAPLLAQPADRSLSALSITIADHRPLAALADELEKRFQMVVTYEEGPWVAAADVEDVTRAVAESNGPGKPPPPVRVIVPRKAAVSFAYPLDPSKVLPPDYPDLLSTLLRQHDEAGAPGKFRVEGRNGIYHLIPSRLKDAKGQWTDASPVLSTPVRLTDEERTVEEALDEIVAQLNESSPVKVGWGWLPLNLFRQTRIRLAADGAPAREVMHQILELLPRHTTWRLNYDPTIKRYYLSFLLR